MRCLVAVLAVTTVAVLALRMGYIMRPLGGPFGRCGSEPYHAVLNKLHPVMDATPPSDRAAKMASIREWANTIPDPCIKANYLSWLDYYAGEYEEKRKTLEYQSKVPAPMEEK